MKELKLIPPTDPRVQSAIAPFNNDMLKDEGFKDRKELSESMFDTMKKYGGIGLSANQVGLPFNMFVLGDHPDVDKNLKSNKNGYIYALDGSKEIPTFLLNDQNSKIDYSELKDGLKIVGDFLNKTVLSPNNINFPTSRNEFTKLI